MSIEQIIVQRTDNEQVGMIMTLMKVTLSSCFVLFRLLVLLVLQTHPNTCSADIIGKLVTFSEEFCSVSPASCCVMYYFVNMIVWNSQEKMGNEIKVVFTKTVRSKSVT